MNRHQLNGAARHLTGRAQSTWGSITGRPSRQLYGAANQLAGGTEYAYGTLTERAANLLDDSREALHHAAGHGRHLTHQGYTQARNHPAVVLAGVAAVALAAIWLVARTRD